MGVDWTRMRPAPGVSPAALTDWVESQAAAFAATGYGRYEPEFDHLPSDAGPGSCELFEHVVVDTGPDCCRRVSAFVLNPVFPAEWRLAAYRSYPPEELPGRLRSWTRHLDRVRHGDHHDYLYAWYRYTTSWHLAHQWQALREHATAARSRTNNWAVRPALVEIREQILTLPAPNVPPAPHWGADLPAVTPPGDPNVWRGQVKAWNSHVPNGQKVRITQPPPFGGFLETALNDQGLTGIFNWIEQAIEDGYGLLLHW